MCNIGVCVPGCSPRGGGGGGEALRQRCAARSSRAGCGWCGRGWWCDRVGGDDDGDDDGDGGGSPWIDALFLASPASGVGGCAIPVYPPAPGPAHSGMLRWRLEPSQLQNGREIQGNALSFLCCRISSGEGRGGLLRYAGFYFGGVSGGREGLPPAQPLGGNWTSHPRSLKQGHIQLRRGWGQGPTPLRVPGFHSLSALE